MNLLFFAIGLLVVFVVISVVFSIVNGRKEGTGQGHVDRESASAWIVISGFLVVFIAGFSGFWFIQSSPPKVYPEGDAKVESKIEDLEFKFSDLISFENEPLNQGER